MEKGFDYEILHRCQYPIARRSCPDGEEDCGEPAAYRGYWGDDDKGWFLCYEHLQALISQVAEKPENS